MKGDIQNDVNGCVLKCLDRGYAGKGLKEEKSWGGTTRIRGGAKWGNSQSGRSVIVLTNKDKARQKDPKVMQTYLEKNAYKQRETIEDCISCSVLLLQ